MKEYSENKRKHRKGRIFLKILLGLLIAAVIFVLAVGISFYFFFENKLNKINYVPLSREEITINEGIEEQLTSYRNIALLGIDTRQDTYNSGRSDGIMIISINEQTHDVKITSVYRDTYLDIKKNETDSFYLDKITHAYAFGNAKLSLSSLNRNLDLNITEFVTVNFNAVVEVVNAVGGIDMDITSEEVKYISGINSAGRHHLNGTQALAYSRIRKAAGGDYKRTERMRDVLVATFEKAKTLNVAQLNKMADTLLPHVSTNIQKDEIFDTIKQIPSFHVTESAGWPSEVKGATIGGVWYGVPVNLEKDVSKLHDDLFGTVNYEPSETVKAISNEIIRRTK